jgi:hypothetical protein
MFADFKFQLLRRLSCKASGSSTGLQGRNRLPQLGDLLLISRFENPAHCPAATPASKVLRVEL